MERFQTAVARSNSCVSSGAYNIILSTLIAHRSPPCPDRVAGFCLTSTSTKLFHLTRSLKSFLSRSSQRRSAFIVSLHHCFGQPSPVLYSTPRLLHPPDVFISLMASLIGIILAPDVISSALRCSSKLILMR